MAHKVVIDNESAIDFGSAINDIANVARIEQSEQMNSEIELKRNYKALIDNFNSAKYLRRKKETYVQQISEFCAVAKSKLKLDNLEAMHSFKLVGGFGLGPGIELSSLMAHFAYFLQSVDYIESLSGDMRVCALEQRGEVLDTLRDAIKPDGIFLKNFYHAVNGKYENVWPDRLNKFLFYAIGVFILQMLFIIEQFSFLAGHYYKNGNPTKYNKYLNNAFLSFQQMKSQLVGKKNLINELPRFEGGKEELAHSEDLSYWQSTLGKMNFPDICERTAQFGTPCYEIESNLQQLTTLHIAAFQADLEVIQAVLQKSLNELNAADPEGFTPLHCAVLADDCVVECLLAYKSIDVNAQSKSGLTALHIAVIINSVEMVQMLLENSKIDVNRTSMDDWTALHVAVALRRVEIVAELLKATKLKINAKIFGQISALHIAARLDEANLIEMLLAKGAEIEKLTDAGSTAQQIAEKFGSKVLKLFENSKQKFLQTTETPEPLLQQSTAATSNCLNKNPAEDSPLPEMQETAETSNADIETGNSDDTAQIEQANSYIAATFLAQLDAEASKDMNTHLFQAVLKGQLDNIKSFVAQGADVAETHVSGKNVLDFAIMSGNLSIFKYFLEEHDLSNSTTDTCLLFSAAELGSLEIVKYFIEEKDLNPQLKNSENTTLLCAAIAKKNFEIVKYLIEDQGVPITSTKKNCPLCAALESNNFTMIKFVLDKGTNILKECDQRKAIFAAAKKTNSAFFKKLLDCSTNTYRLFDYAATVGNLKILKYLVDAKNCKLNTTVAASGLSTLFQFARVGTLEGIKYFVETKKFSILGKGPLKGTILHEVAFNRNLDVIQYFVEKHGLDVKARDDNGFVPLFYAAQQNNLVAVKYFVSDRKLGIHLKDKHNRTALHIAAMEGHFDVVQYLVEEKKANLNVKDNNGLNPLHAYAQNKIDSDLLKYLIDRTSDLNRLTADKANILHLFAEQGNVKIIKYLVDEKGMQTNSKGLKGQTPLFYAAKAGKLEAVKYFVDIKKDDVNIQDNELKTPIFSAVLSENLDLVKFLVTRGASYQIRDVYGRSLRYYATRAVSLFLDRYY